MRFAVHHRSVETILDVTKRGEADRALYAATEVSGLRITAAQCSPESWPDDASVWIDPSVAALRGLADPCGIVEGSWCEPRESDGRAPAGLP